MRVTVTRLRAVGMTAALALAACGTSAPAQTGSTTPIGPGARDVGPTSTTPPARDDPTTTRAWTRSTAMASTGTTLGTSPAAVAGPLDLGAWRILRPAPGGAGQLLAWTGREVVFGPTPPRTDGTDPALIALDPATGRWRRLPRSTVAERALVYAWTGRELLAFGGFGPVPGGGATVSDCVVGPLPAPGRCDHQVDGVAYDPERGTWRPIAPLPLDHGLGGAAWVWTGDRLLLWGITAGLDPGLTTRGRVALAYDPVEDSWASHPAPAQPDGVPTEVHLVGSTVVATALLRPPVGASGTDPWARWAAYDFVTDRWRDLPASPVPLAVGTASAVVSGIEYVVAADGSAVVALDPDAGTWRIVDRPPLDGASVATAADAGGRLFVADDESAAVYDPTTEVWHPVRRPPVRSPYDDERFFDTWPVAADRPTEPAPASVTRRLFSRAAWTGRSVLVVGGLAGGGEWGNPDAYTYTPAELTRAS